MMWALVIVLGSGFAGVVMGTWIGAAYVHYQYDELGLARPKEIYERRQAKAK